MKIIKIGAVWCGACLTMNKVFKELEDKYEMITYDIDFDEDEVEKYNVGEKLPVLIFIDSNDIELGRLIGEHTIDEIESYMEGLNEN